MHIAPKELQLRKFSFGGRFIYLYVWNMVRQKIEDQVKDSVIDNSDLMDRQTGLVRTSILNCEKIN